jgi:hypothetical protein
MKNIASLALAAILLSACSKKEADPQPATPAPVQAATINVAFDYYATGSSPATTQSLSLLAAKPTYQALADRLEVKLESLSSLNFVEDRVQFVIPISRQKTGLVGSYTLASQPDASLGEVLLTYTRPSNSSSAYSNVYSGNQSRLEGSFVITSYDASRRLISGSYSVKALNVKGPFSFLGVGSAGDPRRDGDLRLSGTFQELPLQ